MDSIVIKELNFWYSKELIFDNLNLNIKRGLITSIIGPNGSGKSTLAKILAGLYKHKGTIEIDNTRLNKQNKKKIRKKISVLFSNPDDYFVADTVMDDIVFSLENLNLKKPLMNQKLEEVSNYLGISELYKRNPRDLNSSDKQLVAFAGALIYEPEILILDDALNMIDPSKKKLIHNLLKNLSKNQKVTIINITNDMEETLISDEIIVLDKGKLILQGTKDKVYEQEKVLNNLKIELPFIVKLSRNLMYYKLLNNVIYDMEKLVDALWK